VLTAPLARRTSLFCPPSTHPILLVTSCFGRCYAQGKCAKKSEKVYYTFCHLRLNWIYDIKEAGARVTHYLLGDIKKISFQVIQTNIFGVRTPLNSAALGNKKNLDKPNILGSFITKKLKNFL
jgi:hypothetical protein